jgi:hypothetical protein
MFSFISAEMPEQYRTANAPPPRGVAGRNKVFFILNCLTLSFPSFRQAFYVIRVIFDLGRGEESKYT